jgi:hypothetical protein
MKMASFLNLLPLTRGDKRGGAGCGDFFRSLLDVSEPGSTYTTIEDWRDRQIAGIFPLQFEKA